MIYRTKILKIATKTCTLVPINIITHTKKEYNTTRFYSKSKMSNRQIKETFKSLTAYQTNKNWMRCYDKTFRALRVKITLLCNYKKYI